MNTENSALYLGDNPSTRNDLVDYQLDMEESDDDEKIPQISKNSTTPACFGNDSRQYLGLCSD
jgi:hypothetical protein